MESDARPLLAVDGLSVDFRTRHGKVSALKGVDLHVARGEVLGVVGESGSGKSVTAYSVMGLLERTGEISAGSMDFHGIALAGADESTLSDLRGREISMIFQNPRAALNPIRTVGQQISDVLRRHARASRQDAKAKAIALLEKVQIRDPERRYDAYPFELSGGMCQRVMIAMALACEPRLLIADEPTTGLDVTTQKATMDLVAELTREQGLSVMLITHDLGLAACYCDRIVVMQEGKVVETGPVQSLFSNPQHPYTQKLVATSPRADSTLADLVAASPEAAPATVAAEPVSTADNAEPILQVRNLVKTYAKGQSGIHWPWRKPTQDDFFRAVDGISFDLYAGECLGLVGESGCGKSTTSSMITRLLDTTSGEILFKGEDISQYSAGEFASMPQRREIQMVFQDPHGSLDPRYTAADAIAEPLIRLCDLKDKTQRQTRVNELADMVGLPQTLLTRLPHQLSGGQKARVGIARAIATNPSVLILDEPTSALDVSVQAVVLQLLDRLKRELGLSYIFVSHDLNVVRLLCERVLVMNGGRIVEEGKTEEVLREPKEVYTRELIGAIPQIG